MARGRAVHFGMDEVRSVAVDVEAHVASVEPEDGVRLHGCIVHEHLCLLDGSGGGQRFLGADFIECDKHCGVDGARDLEKSSGSALHLRDAAFVKFRCGRGVRRVLHLGPIRRPKPFVGRVLGACGYGVTEMFQGLTDGVGHGDVDVIARVVPFDGNPKVHAARWVDGDVVICPDCVEEVGGVGGGEELDSKVIYSEDEGGRQGCVGPKTRGVGHRSVAVGSVAMGLEVADKALVGIDAGFLESAHFLYDIDVDISSQVRDGEDGVLNDHLVWDVF